MEDLTALTHQLEYLFLKRIIAGLRDKTISIVQAKQYANDFLFIEPFNSSEDAYSKTINFLTQHPQFTELSSYMEVFEKEKDVPGKINKMREYIKQNNIEAALQVAQA